MAVSKWVYPFWRAATKLLTPDWPVSKYVPKPILGICLPELNVMVENLVSFSACMIIKMIWVLG